MRLSQVCTDTTPAQALLRRTVGSLAVWSALLRRTSLDQFAGQAGGVQRITHLRFGASSVAFGFRRDVGQAYHNLSHIDWATDILPPQQALLVCCT